MSLTSPVRPGTEVPLSEGSGTSGSPVEPGPTVELPAVEGVLPSPAGDPAVDETEPAREVGLRVFLAGSALTILGVLLLGLVVELAVMGPLQHARDQQVLFDRFRLELATGVLPVGQERQLEVSETGEPVTELVGEGDPVAYLRIPALGLEEVVVEGTSSGALISGPGHRRDSVMPGQAGSSVVMGRQSAYGGPFGDLTSLRPGDTVEVTTGQGEQVFEVTGIRRAGDPATAAAPGTARLTLITADGPPFLARETVRVDARLTSEVQPVPARPIGTDALPAADDAMGVDDRAWLPLMLWAQALLAASLGVVWAAIRWGRWQAWLVGLPVLAFVGLSTTQQVARLLPNLL